MTYVSLNPEGMQKVITDLSGYAAKTREQHSSVASANERNDSPVELSSYLQVIAGSASVLEDKAKDLQARLDSARTANECGLTPAGVDGMISYYIPDGEVDTSKNALAFNRVETVRRAEADAAALYQAKHSPTGRSSDGRSFNQILDEMKEMRDDPLYSSRLIISLGEQLPLVEGDYNKDGAKRFVEIMQVARQSCTAETLSSGFENLSHILAAASRSDVSGKRVISGTELADKIYQAGSSNYESRLTLNAAISEFSNSNKIGYISHNPNERLAFFGTDFLVNLAKAYEKDDASKSKGRSEVINGSKYDADVLGSVILSMGEDPRAVLEYMAGSGEVDSNGNWIPSEEGQKRWDMLKQRGWDTTRIEYFISAVGAASSYRNTAYEEGSPQYLKDADARATWLSSQGIRYMNEKVKKSDITKKMKEGAALIVANSPEEVTAVANGKQIGEGSSGPVLQNVDDSQLAKLLYRVMDDEDAARTISVGVGAYQHSLIEQRMSHDEKRTRENIGSQYKIAAATETFLREISDKKLADNNAQAQADYEKRKEGVGRAIDIFSAATVLGAGALTAGCPPLGAALAVGGTELGAAVLGPVAADAITGERSDPPTTAIPEGAASGYDTLRMRAYSDAAKYNLLDERSVNMAKDKGVLFDGEGNPVGAPLLVDDNGNPVSVDEKGSPVPSVDREGKPVQVHMNDKLKEYVQKTNSWSDSVNGADKGEVADATVKEIDNSVMRGSTQAREWVEDKFGDGSSLRE